MSNSPKCCNCGKFCGWMADNGIVYGCADPGAPEPYDPDYWCKKCAKKEYVTALIEKEKMYIYYQMPNWQIKALKKLNLGKVTVTGIPKLILTK